LRCERQHAVPATPDQDRWSWSLDRLGQAVQTLDMDVAAVVCHGVGAEERADNVDRLAETIDSHRRGV